MNPETIRGKKKKKKLLVMDIISLNTKSKNTSVLVNLYDLGKSLIFSQTFKHVTSWENSTDSVGLIKSDALENYRISAVYLSLNANLN